MFSYSSYSIQIYSCYYFVVVWYYMPSFLFEIPCSQREFYILLANLLSFQRMIFKMLDWRQNHLWCSVLWQFMFFFKLNVTTHNTNLMLTSGLFGFICFLWLSLPLFHVRNSTQKLTYVRHVFYHWNVSLSFWVFYNLGLYKVYKSFLRIIEQTEK